MKNKKYLIFVIQAYEGLTPQMTLMDSCTLDLIDTSVNNAIARAKKIITKKKYRVQRVIESLEKE